MSNPPPRSRTRNPPALPTPSERLLLLSYPATLVFGALFSLLSPPAPSYFSRKDNLLNVLFVKRGWAWISLAFAAFARSSPAVAGRAGRAWAATRRWAAVTAWWVLVTQWCFGPPVIDRGFRWTGGRCAELEAGDARREAGVAGPGLGLEQEVKEAFTAAACRAVGGRWAGGHDISGHVFLLVLGSAFLAQEVGWAWARWGAGVSEERAVVMPDGAVKSAGVEAEREGAAGQKGGDALGWGGRFAVGVVVLCWWMMLMTAIYFHTWFEKVRRCVRVCGCVFFRLLLTRDGSSPGFWSLSRRCTRSMFSRGGVPHCASFSGCLVSDGQTDGRMDEADEADGLDTRDSMERPQSHTG